jgi:uncharacterized membrane protein YsdA (DUF1294 family)
MTYFILFIVLNAAAYFTMWRDKQLAKRGAWRISERALFTFALLGGSLGIWLGTKAPLFHKSAHWQFRIGVPLIALTQVLLAWWFL